MKRDWSYLINPFEVATKNSFQKALHLSYLHYVAIQTHQSITFFADMLTYFTPFYNTISTEYVKRMDLVDRQMGKTTNLNNLIQQLMEEKIKQWEIAIQLVYPRGTSDYKCILPHNKIPFQNGSNLKRINTVSVLSLSLSHYPALASVKTDVDNFFNIFNDAYSKQEQSKRAVASQNIVLEKARKDVCTAMYRDLGLLMSYYYLTPDMCSHFFDIHTIRNAAQVNFTGHLKSKKIHFICKRTFTPDDNITITNLNDFPIKMYLAQMKKSLMPENAFTIEANTTITIKASQLGDLAFNHLFIYNPNESLVAKWEIKLE